MEQHVDDVLITSQIVRQSEKFQTNIVYNKSINPQCQCHPALVMKPRKIKPNPEQLLLTEESKLTCVQCACWNAQLCVQINFIILGIFY